MLSGMIVLKYQNVILLRNSNDVGVKLKELKIKYCQIFTKVKLCKKENFVKKYKNEILWKFL